VQSVNDLFFGVWKHPWKTMQYAFTCFSVLFTIVKATNQFIPSIQIHGPIALGLALVISVVYALKQVWKPSKITFKVPTCYTTIEILYGDIFEQDGLRAIAVSEYFDTKLGRPVSDKSLHGAFLMKCFGGVQEGIDKLIDEQLENVDSTTVPKVEGKIKCYPIGTTALIKVVQDCYILFAFTKADPNTCKAYSDVELMWKALHRLWQRAREDCGGHSLNLPLVGSGLSGLGLPTHDLLNLLLLSAITETKATEITQVIRIVLHRDRFEDVDLREIKAQWER
jgi:hypothetical protein